MSEPVRLVPCDEDQDRGGYTVIDVAERLGVTLRAVRRYIERGQLEAKRITTPRGIEWRSIGQRRGEDRRAGCCPY